LCPLRKAVKQKGVSFGNEAKSETALQLSRVAEFLEPATEAPRFPGFSNYIGSKL
jgi:hypothetical protein